MPRLQNNNEISSANLAFDPRVRIYHAGNSERAGIGKANVSQEVKRHRGTELGDYRERADDRLPDG
jgi:hypothetical protein